MTVKTYNKGFLTRRQVLLSNNGIIEMRGNIGSGFFNCGKYLIKQTKLSLVSKNGICIARFRFV